MDILANSEDPGEMPNIDTGLDKQKISAYKCKFF